MLNSNARKQIEQTFEKYGYQPQLIVGKSLPKETGLFYEHNSECGREVALVGYHPLGKDGKVMKCFEVHEELQKAQSEYFWDFSDTMDASNGDITDEEYEAVNNRHRESLSKLYKDALEKELKNGVVRLPYAAEVHDKKARVKSRYCSLRYNFSPEILSVCDISKMDIECFANLYTDAYINPFECNLITVYIGREANEEELVNINEMMKEVFEIINISRIEEYEERKGEEDYKHRNDLRPDNF